jgi:hypothetical protein
MLIKFKVIHVEYIFQIMSYNTYSVNAEDIDEEDFRVLSQTSNYSHTTHDEGLNENEDNCEYLPSSEDLSSQEFSSQDFSQVCKYADFFL